MEERTDEGAGDKTEHPSSDLADETTADSPEAEQSGATDSESAPSEPSPPVRQAAAQTSSADLESLVPPVFRDKYETAQKEEEERAIAEAAARAEEEVRAAEEARAAEERAAEERAAAEAAAAEAAANGEGEGATVTEGVETEADDTTAQPAALGDDMLGVSGAKGRIPWWPYLVYLVAWIALIATAVLTISYGTDALPAVEQEYYAYVLLGGLVLTIAGPLLSLLVWFVVRYRTPKGERSGLFSSALIKGASVTLFGVIAWWGALVLLDALRLGMLKGIV